MFRRVTTLGEIERIKYFFHAVEWTATNRQPLTKENSTIQQYDVRGLFHAAPWTVEVPREYRWVMICQRYKSLRFTCSRSVIRLWVHLKEHSYGSAGDVQWLPMGVLGRAHIPRHADRYDTIFDPALLVTVPRESKNRNKKRGIDRICSWLA